MKNWFWMPLAAIVGIIAGSWGPREDMKALESKFRAERSSKKMSVNAGFDAFAHLANIPERAVRRKAVQPQSVPAAQPAQDPQTPKTVQSQPPRPRPKNLSNEDLQVRIDEAAELWRTRVELATVQWKDKLGLSSGAGSASFDSAVSAMNEQLRETMQAMADEIMRTGKMTPELGLRLMGDASRAMAEAYDAIGAAMPDDRRDEVSEIPVFEFIDPAVAEPMIGVQDKLGDADFGGRRR